MSCRRSVDRDVSYVDDTWAVDSGEQAFDMGMGMPPKIDLVQDAKHVACMASQGHVTEDFAVRYLANIAGQHDAPRLREAAIDAKNDPDAVPLVVALLERAAELAAKPPQRHVRAIPDTRHFTAGG